MDYPGKINVRLLQIIFVSVITMPTLTGFIFFDLIFLLCTVFLAIYVYFINAYKYWKEKGVPYLEPKFPLGKYIINITIIFYFIAI